MESVEAKDLRFLLRYDAETGKLYWLPRMPEHFAYNGGHSPEHSCAKWNANFAGKEAFIHQTKNGYLCGRIFGRLYLAHRVIWALIHSEWPPSPIDHRDRDKQNNRGENLRLASKSQNAANSKKQAGRSSKYRGVCWQKSAGKWTAGVYLNGKRKHLGLFNCEEDAARAYDRAASEIHGDFHSPNIEAAAA